MRNSGPRRSKGFTAHLTGKGLGLRVHATCKIKYLKKEARGFARSIHARFLCGREGGEGSRPVGEAEVGTDAFESLLIRSGGGSLKFEECGSRRAKRANGMSDDKVQLFFTKAAGNVGSPQAEDLVQKLLLELEDLDFAWNG